MELDVSKSFNSKDKKVIKSKKAFTNYTLRKPGFYYWRVRAKGNRILTTSWSSVGYFQIKEERDSSPPQSPQLISKTIIHKAKRANDFPPPVRWSMMSDSIEYEVIFSDDRNFQSIFNSYKTQSNQQRLKMLKVGEHFFKVRAKKWNGKWGPYSEVGQLQVEGLPPSISSNQVISGKGRYFGDKGGEKPVKISWDDSFDSSLYEVLYSSNPNFSKPKSYIVKKDETELVLPRTGEFYAKVRLLDNESRKPASIYSKPMKMTYQVVNPLQSPNVISPQNDLSILAYAKENQIIFYWSSVVGVKRYKFEIATDENFNNIILTKIVKKPRFILKKKLDDNTYYWRVRSEHSNEDLSSPWTQTRSLKIVR